MKLFFRILAYSKPYPAYLIPYIFFTVFAIIFGVLNFGILIPLLDYLFNPENSIKVVNELPSFSLSSSYFKQLLDYFTYQFGGEDKQKALLVMCIVIGICVFLSNVFKYLSQYVLTKVRTKLVYNLKEALYEKIIRLDMGFFTSSKKGNLLSIISTDVHEIENSIVGSIQVVFREPFVIISYFILLFSISAKLTLFSIIYFPIVGIVIALITKSLRKKMGQLMFLQGDLLSLVEETISNIRVIKAFNNIPFFSKKFGTENEKYKNLSRSIINKRELSSPISEVLGVSAVVGLIIYGGSLVLNNTGELSGSQFLTYLVVFAMILGPAKNITVAIANIQKGLASGDRVFEIIDTNIQIKNEKHAEPISVFKNEIEFNNVSFSYKKGDDGFVLKNINLNVKCGKTIALVGQSGSGKTTLADMIPRFYDTDLGEIKIDGLNIKSIEIESLRNQIGVVTQESILFNDTIENNISFGLKNTSKEQIIEAAKIANAHQFIMEQANGYQTNIGDRGGKLSGGQRQRISIARAILKNPPILILDEATSALDTESERLVQDALTKLMENRTSIVIAHRLSTIINADEIIVLDKGEIVEKGSHDELLLKQGIYKKLFDMQNFK